MVRYDLFLKDGKHIKQTYACFGLLNDLPWSRYSINSSVYQDSAQLEAAKQIADQTDTDNLSFVQYLPESSFYHSAWSCPDGNPSRTLKELPDESIEDRDARCLKAYFSEMKLLLEDLPMLKGAVTIHPLAKCVRVHIPGNEADKVALSLFLFRNLAQDEYIHGYRLLRKMGYRPRIAAVIAHTVIYAPASPFQVARWYAASQDENSWINPYTFGKNGFISLIKQEEDWTPWYQDLFENQSNGYYRDEHFSDGNDDGFTISLDSGESYNRNRRLTDAFSVECDQKLNELQNSSRYDMFHWDEGGLPDEPISVIFDPLIVESGISPTL
jgi:hypothetical protein